MYQGLKVDNVLYPNVHIASLKREAEVLDGKHSKRATNGNMIRDIIGTYYNYTINIESDEAGVTEYDNLFEVLSAPVDYHMVEFPYAQSIQTFKAYVTKVSDELESVTPSRQRWNAMSFKFVAMAPNRR